MKENYVPLKKVIQELKSGFFKKIKPVRELMYDCFVGLEIGALVNTVPYALPTFLRRAMKEGKKNEESLSEKCMEDYEKNGKDISYNGVDYREVISSSLGFLFAFALAGAQVFLAKENPKLLYVPLTTNVVSGIYESFRFAREKYNKAKQSVLEEQKKQGNLESKL